MKSLFVEINERFGIDAFRDESRLRGLMSDLCAGQFAKERKQIKSLYECGIEKLFLNATDGTDEEKQAAIDKARYQMDDKLGLKQEDIDVLIECFAVIMKYDAPVSNQLRQPATQRRAYTRDDNLEYFKKVPFADLYTEFGVENWRQLKNMDDTALNELRIRWEARSERGTGK